ncbi:MAG: hypothetical protein ACLSA2_11500 [Candidatus Gastranaerophilaceae bacterium]
MKFKYKFKNFVKELSEKANCEYISGSIRDVAKALSNFKENDVVIGQRRNNTNLRKQHLNEVAAIGH